MRRAEPVAGFGGILLLVSLFLPWYRLDLVETISSGGSSSVAGPEFTGWQALSVIDVVIALIALLAILVPVTSLASRGPAKPIAAAVIASALGWIAVLLVVFRLIDSPADGLELRYGAWLGLAGALAAWIGSWLSLSDESTPGAVPPDIPRRPAPNISGSC